MPERIVIVGNGVAGIEAALTVRAREPSWDITIVSEESDHFFSRTALMWVATGQLSHRCIEPYERDLYDRMSFRRVRARAVGLDLDARELRLAGELPPLPYDRLLLACGSRPRPGPWPGSTLDGVGHFVTHQDLQWLEEELHGGPGLRGGPPRPDAHLGASTDDSPYRFRRSLRQQRGGPPQRPAVIGGGLIGIEAVEVMHAAGLHPRFFIREEWFWTVALDAWESRWIAERMGEQGVEVLVDHDVLSLDGDAHVTAVSTDHGTFETDLVVVAIGVVPNTGWLRGSGLALDERGGGVLVDERLRAQPIDAGDSEDPTDLGVFAAGDCAAVRWFDGSVRPEQLWYTARDQGRVAGRGLLGDTARYGRGPWYNSAKLFDIEYTTAGLVNMNVAGEANWRFEEQGPVRSTSRVVVADGRVVGFNFLGRRWDHSVLLRWIDERRDLRWVLDHLNEAGFDTELVPPLRIPAEAKGAPLQGPTPSGVPGPIPPPVG